MQVTTGEIGLIILDILEEVINTISNHHPGFRDKEYVFRRNQIAKVARSYVKGSIVPEVEYSKEEHKVWSVVYKRLSFLYESKACKEFLSCFKEFNLNKNKIPQFKQLNQKLESVKFSISPVEGLVSPREFLVSLSESNMLCTQYIRHFSAPDYTPEPDIIHEVFGHAVFFFNKKIRDINKLFGLAALKSSDLEIESLMRIYWYTMEFGVCLENDEVKAYGAGLLSSTEELSNIKSVKLRRFNIEEMKKTPYDTMDTQPLLFCSKNLNQSMQALDEHLRKLL